MSGKETDETALDGVREHVKWWLEVTVLLLRVLIHTLRLIG